MSDLNHGLVGAYAADACDDAEREEFEAHLRVCADCRAEVDSLREATATLAEATAAAPPPQMRGRVMAQISAVRPLPPLPPSEERPVAPPADELTARRKRRRLINVVGVAAAAVVLTVGLGVTQPWSDGEQPSPSQQVLQADDALRTSLDLGDGARATVVHSESIGQSVIQTEDMPPAPAGSVYQLWYVEDDDYVSAGLMPTEGGDQTVRLQGDSGEATGVGITVEPDGGSQTPSEEPIAMFDFGPAA